MRTRIERAHLYVEKYSKSHREILLDFVREEEFIYFRNRGDYTQDMHLYEGRYEPTMLLIHGCDPARKLREGAILTVPMDKLLALLGEMPTPGFRGAAAGSQPYPATVYLEIGDGAGFARLIDDPATAVSTYIRREFTADPAPSRTVPPCPPVPGSEHLELRVWKVGQGSTNSISDSACLTLFDFGASVYSTWTQLERILRDHAPLFEDKDRITVIISHWDSDHCNLLCAADDTFLEKISGIFYPPGAVTLTAKQIGTRIEMHCPCRVRIDPAPRTAPSRCGIQPVLEGRSYTLFTGERSGSANRAGLLLALYSKSETALLTADHTNYQVWDNLYGAVRQKERRLHIVVPHHGGNGGRPGVPRGVAPGTAVVSTGSNNYNHPRAQTLEEYRRARYHLVRTDRCESDVVIPMR